MASSATDMPKSSCKQCGAEPIRGDICLYCKAENETEKYGWWKRETGWMGVR